MKVGAHFSAEGGYQSVIDAVEKTNSLATQIFVSPPQQGFVRAKDPEEEQMLRQYKSRMRMSLLVHGPFVINLCSTKGDKTFGLTKSVMYGIMIAADRIGADWVVTHVGSRGEKSEEEAINNAVDMISWLLYRVPGQRLLLETDAGGGTRVAKLSTIAKIIQKVDSPRVGAVVDSAHMFASGVDLRHPDITKVICERYGEYIKAIHVNDPDLNVILGRHLDRHKGKLGEGAIGEEGLRRLVKEFQDRILIAETAAENQKYNIDMIKKWIQE